jgi:predicted dehydrogenase
VVGEVDINAASAINPGFFDVWGTRGAISLPPGDTSTFRVRRLAPGALRQKKLDPSLASAGRRFPGGPAGFIDSTIPVEEKYRVDVYEDFARAIRRGTKPFVSPEEPLAVMRMIERCRESAGRIVRTPAHPPSAA